MSNNVVITIQNKSYKDFPSFFMTQLSAALSCMARAALRQFILGEMNYISFTAYFSESSGVFHITKVNARLSLSIVGSLFSHERIKLRYHN